jgi:uncharacterized protein YjbI with pentapeptide repeats
MNLTQLDPDTFGLILDKLAPEDISALCATNSQFRSLCSNAQSMLWQKLMDRDYPQFKDYKNTWHELNNIRDMWITLLQTQNTPIMTGAFLASAILSDRNVMNIALHKTNLNGAKFIQCDLKNVDFVDSSLIHTIFQHTELDNINFTNCSVENAQFINVSSIGTHFIRCNMSDTIFRNCHLAITEFDSSLLLNTKFENSDLIDTNFHNVNLQGADFSSTKCTRCTWMKIINLSQANFAGTIFDYLDFEDTDMSLADFSRSLVLNP